jgi:cold shock CspA family protein
MRGKIIDYKIDRGFGFILGEDGKKYFFHISNTKTPLEIDIKVLVDFEFKQSSKGLVAENIVINPQSIMKNMIEESFNHMNNHINTHATNHITPKQQKKANPIFEISDINDDIHYINVESIMSYNLETIIGFYDDEFDDHYDDYYDAYYNHYGEDYYNGWDDYVNSCESYYYWLNIVLKSGAITEIHLAANTNCLRGHHGNSSHENEQYKYACSVLTRLKKLIGQS